MKDSSSTELRKKARELAGVYQHFLAELERIEKEENHELREVLQKGDKEELDRLMSAITNI